MCLEAVPKRVLAGIVPHYPPAALDCTASVEPTQSKVMRGKQWEGFGVLRMALPAVHRLSSGTAFPHFPKPKKCTWHLRGKRAPYWLA